jgi:hypothetical protein
MESDAPLVEATPAGLLFADWISDRRCAKSTAYRMRSELGIEPERRRRGGVVEVWLSQQQADLMTAYAEALGRGMSTAEALEAVGHGSAIVETDGARRNPPPLVPMESAGASPSEPMESGGADEKAELEALCARLEALERACRSGAPLTTREAELLLGAHPCRAAELTGGRITATKTHARLGHWNCWVLERID